MATMLLTTIVTELRGRLGDLGEYRVTVVPLGSMNGSNKRFHVPLFPIKDGYEVYKDDVLISTGYTLDQDTGLLTYTTAPAASSTHYLSMTYYQYSFTTLVTFIKRGIRWLESVWNKSWTYAGSGTNETIEEKPTDEQLEVILVAAERESLCYELTQAMRLPAQITAGGRVVRIDKATQLRDRITRLGIEVRSLAKQVGEADKVKAKAPVWGKQWKTDPDSVD